MKRDLTRWVGTTGRDGHHLCRVFERRQPATTAPSSAAPSESASTAPSESASASASAAAGGFEQFVADAKLLADAKAEGTLSTIALPHDWCNYGESISTFKERTGLEVNELDPNAGSGDEVEAIKANKDNPGPSAPDVIDVGCPSARRQRARTCSRRTRSRPGMTSRPMPRMPKGSGGATITGSIVRGEHAVVTERPGGLAGPPEAGIQRAGGPGGRPADVQPGDPGGVCGRPSPTAGHSTTRSPVSTSSRSSTTRAT